MSKLLSKIYLFIVPIFALLFKVPQQTFTLFYFIKDIYYEEMMPQPSAPDRKTLDLFIVPFFVLLFKLF
jgi:hypothetical protein